MYTPLDKSPDGPAVGVNCFPFVRLLFSFDAHMRPFLPLHPLLCFLCLRDALDVRVTKR